MRRRQTLNVPFVLNNPYRVGIPRSVSVAALELGDGYFCVEYQLGVEQVVLFSVRREEVGSRYSLLDEPVAAHVALLKRQALDHGATPEAIRLLGRITPLTKQEEATMAENKKLAKKGDAEGLKAAAKAAPVAPKAEKAAAPKAKGNAEALAKARADKGPDNRKIAINPDHKKGNPYRDGTKAHATFEHMKTCKTVQDFKDGLTSDHDGGYLRYASRDGYITLS